MSFQTRYMENLERKTFSEKTGKRMNKVKIIFISGHLSGFNC